MSFKRDGNDSKLLSVLQKRRIRDLLSEDIPEEEAKLLSNGRFTCLVCSYHPIFDTVSMLSVHRQGKKHILNAEIQEKKKSELKQLIAKRKQDQFLKNVSTPILPANSAHRGIRSGLSVSLPYDPRVRKCNMKKGGRKLQVDLHSGSTSTSSNIPESLSQSQHTAKTNAYPSSSSFSLRVAEQQLNGPIKHDNKLKNVFREKSGEMVRISPYVPKAKPDKNCPILKQNDITPMACFNKMSHSQCTSLKKTIYNINSVPCVLSQNAVTNTISTTIGQIHEPHAKSPQTCDSAMPPNSKEPHSSTSTQSSEQLSGTRQVKRKRKDQVLPNTSKKISREQDHLTEKYFQLQGSGWKRDWDGKWIKDEQAEFDSDEEPPDLP